jgi:hypothetical protein
MKKAFKRSLIVGCAAGFLFLVFSVVGVIMVNGDGTAPAFTHLMLKLNELPFRLVGARVSDKMLLVGAGFWGVVIAAPVLLIALAVGDNKEA